MSNTTKGIVYICSGALCLVINDAFSKYLVTYYPVLEIIFFRMLFSLPFIIGFGWLVAGRQAFRTRAPVLQVVRGVVTIAAPITYIYGLEYLPLASNAAISFAAPLFITVMAVVLLGERPGVRQWLAAFAGFVGVLLVVQPGADVFTWGALFPLGAALAYAIMMLSARMLADQGDSVWVTMLYATWIPLLLSAVALFWEWQPPAPEHWLALIAVGIFGGASIALITQAFRVGTASVVAPFDYSGLLWAAVIGWVFWGELPTAVAFVGMAVIIASGVYLALQQGALRRKRR